MSAPTYLQSAVADPITASRTLHFSAGSIVGLVDRPRQTSGLIAALANAGIQREQIEIMRAYDLTTCHPSFIQRMTDLLHSVGPECELDRRYRTELAAGATVVTVRDVPAGQHDAVALALKTAGGHCIHSFGRFTMRTLAP